MLLLLDYSTLLVVDQALSIGWITLKQVRFLSLTLLISL